MRSIYVVAIFVSLFFYKTAFAIENEPATCRLVRLSDIGWTDVSATTAVTAELLKELGYQPKVSLLSLPVTLNGLANQQLDVFLGNWMPTQKGDIGPYIERNAFVQLAPNLKGAKFTLAVPHYVYEAGVHSIADLHRYKAQFKNTIYGIEPGNDGNQQILRMIKDDAYHLNGFELVESSEQGMLITVKNALPKKQWVVFLAWEPHPMNTQIPLKYLTGGEDYFGPNYGEATVYTLVRQGLSTECPVLSRFLKQLHFSLQQENELMDSILTRQLKPEEAAQKWLKEHPEFIQNTFKNMGLPNDTAPLLKQAQNNLLPSKKIRLGEWAEERVQDLNTHFSSDFNTFSSRLENALRGIIDWCLAIPVYVAIFWLAFLAFLMHRSFWMGSATFLGLALIANLGLWEATVQTLTLIMLATGFSVVIGVPIGIYCGHRPWSFRLVQPILDLMQTIPTFVYLIPTLMLFGLGMVPGLISTIIFALPAPIRLTYLGIREVPVELKEAGIAFGATKWQLLRQVELPAAKATVVEGISQCIMLSLSMVVIAALVGADGLGAPVVRALNTVNIGLGFDSGLSIVVIAILLDRLLRHSKKKELS